MKKYKVIKKIKSSDRFNVYLAKNDQKIKVVIKSVVKLDDKKSIQLLNQELDAYKFLSRYNKLGIKFPKLIDYYKKDDRLYIVTEYINGKRLSQTPKDKQLLCKIKVINMLSKSVLIREEIVSSQIRILNTLNIIVSLFYFFIKCSVNNYVNVFEYSKKYIFCLSNFRNLLTRKIVIVHRDIKNENIILKDSNLYLIDLEQVVLSHKEFDFNMLYIREGDREKEYLRSKYPERYNKALIYYICFSYVSSNNYVNRYYKNYLKILNNKYE